MKKYLVYMRFNNQEYKIIRKENLRDAHITFNNLRSIFKFNYLELSIEYANGSSKIVRNLNYIK